STVTEYPPESHTHCSSSAERDELRIRAIVFEPIWKPSQRIEGSVIVQTYGPQVQALQTPSYETVSARPFAPTQSIVPFVASGAGDPESELPRARRTGTTPAFMSGMPQIAKPARPFRRSQLPFAGPHVSPKAGCPSDVSNAAPPTLP